jgi:DNA-directed RNA polymerase subunit beta'
VGPAQHPDPRREGGVTRFEDIKEGKTVKPEKSSTASSARSSSSTRATCTRRSVIEDSEGNPLALIHPLPEKAYIEVEDGERIEAGTLIAKTPREMTGHAGHHRWSAACDRALRSPEARRTRPCISEIDGRSSSGEKKRGKRTSSSR